MSFYIGIEDLVANALIESKQSNRKRFLTYQEIEEYGAQVIRILNENGEKAVLSLSRETTNAMFRNYSEFFEEREFEGAKGIELKDGKEKEDLINQFRGYLPLDVLMAFVNQKAVRILGA